MKKNKFNPASKMIFDLLVMHLKKTDKVLEIGCSSAHISIVLRSMGYNISGIEIRKDVVEETRDMLAVKEIKFDIYHDDILKYTDKQDIIWSSGLLQCLSDVQKEIFLKHFVTLAPLAIFIVPQREKYLPPLAQSFQVGVSGCEEFPTGNIPYLLSKYYGVVRMGIMSKIKINLDKPFFYFVCERIIVPLNTLPDSNLSS